MVNFGPLVAEILSLVWGTPANFNVFRVVNFGPLVAEILSLVWGTPANFNVFRVLAALLYGI